MNKKMKHVTHKTAGLKKGTKRFKRIILLFSTIIGMYGILTAPESDTATLEQELMQNQKILQEMNTTVQAKTKSDDKKEIQKGAKIAAKKPENTISVIGDSVFLGAALSFQKLQKNAYIDAKVSRQVYHAIDVAKQMKKKGKLGNTVIISLGTNGQFNSDTGQKLIDYLGEKRTIYWVNAYGKKLSWQKNVNQTIKKLAGKNKNVRVINWAKEAKKHSDWFYQDGIHLNGKGQGGFARFIKKQLA